MGGLLCFVVFSVEKNMPFSIVCCVLQGLDKIELFLEQMFVELFLLLPSFLKCKNYMIFARCLFLLCVVSNMVTPSSRQHQSSDDCLEENIRLSELLGAVLCSTVVCSDTHRHT